MAASHRSTHTRRTSLAVALAALVAAAPAVAADRALLSGLQADQSYTGVIVKFRANSPEFRDAKARDGAVAAALGRAAPLLRATAGKALPQPAQRRMAVGADLLSLSTPLDANDVATLVKELAANPNVEYVEPDILLQPSFTPNDTRYGEQWHYFEATGGLNLPTAWNSANGSGVVVAVLDTGIVAHSDLDANVVAGYDFVSNASAARDGNGRDSNPRDEGDWCGWFQCPSILPTNSSWHGTHVAGTIAAVTNNGKGVAGVAYGAKIQPVRVLGRGGGALSDISDAIIWASGGAVGGVPVNTNPAEVINLSLGGSGACGGAMQAAVSGAVSRGSVVVVAAGNSNANASGFTPASCTGAIAVAATNRAGGRASYSNFGSIIKVSAPGGTGSAAADNVLSTLNAGTQGPGAESYAFYAGTSMAAPHVAGVAALIQSAGSPKTPAQVLSILQSTARPLPGACSGGCGAGIVNAAAAVGASGN